MRSILWTFLFVVAVQSVAAQYYADVTLDVEETGAVTVSGVSNHPELAAGTTHAFTSKNKEYWLLNVTAPNLDEFLITVKLPAGAELNYVSAKSAVGISSEGERVVLKRIGSNSSVELVAQYRLADQVQRAWLPYLIVAVAALVLFTSILYGVVARGLVRRPRKALTFNDGLPQRQKDILQLLERSGGKLTQKQIEDALRLPKSSVSRNIDALARRGLVAKQTQGFTNTIHIISE